MAFFTEDITTQQIFSRRQLGLLWARRESLDGGTVSILDSLYKNRNKGDITGSVAVKYTLSKSRPGKLGYGRLYGSKGSFETLECDCRGTICDEFYHDIDVVNAHPTFLVQYANRTFANNEFPMVEVQKYVDNRNSYLAQISENRDEAKIAIIKIMYGGKNEFPFLDAFKSEVVAFTDKLWDEVKHDKLRKHCMTIDNSKGSFLSFILQTEERRVMLSMRGFFKLNGWSPDVLSYDGVMIRKNPALVFGEQLLKDCAMAVYEDTKYKIVLTNKFFSVITFTDADKAAQPAIADLTPLVNDDITVDDIYGARQFAKLCGCNLVLDSGIVWIFNEDNGMWSDKESDIRRAITSCGWRLKFRKMSPFGVLSVRNFSGDVLQTKTLIIKLPDILTPQNGYFYKRMNSDLGYVLFEDGIYNFKTQEFISGFDRDIIFRASIPRKFMERDTAIVNDVLEFSFISPFSNNEDADVLKHNLMRALIGDYIRKKMVIGLGFTNSGKGMLIQLCQTAFGSYVSTFNGADLLAKRGDGESSRSMGWVKDIANCRFSFGSEIPLNNTVDGNMLKSIVSGGDVITARGLWENNRGVINKSTLFLFAQDMPAIKPSADCVKGRLHAINWSYSFVDEPVQPFERITDKHIAHKYKDDEYGNALFWILVDEYQKWSNSGFKELALTETMRETLESIIPVMNPVDIITKIYEFTDNENDMVLFSSILDLIHTNKCDISSNSLGRILSSHKTNTIIKKHDGVNTRFRTNMKIRDVTDE